MDVCRGFQMYGDHGGACFHIRFNLSVWLRDHQMHIEWDGRDRVKSRHDGNTNTYLGNKVSIHDVDVNQVCSSIFNGLYGLAKRTKVSRKYGWCDAHCLGHGY